MGVNDSNQIVGSLHQTANGLTAWLRRPSTISSSAYGGQCRRMDPVQRKMGGERGAWLASRRLPRRGGRGFHRRRHQRHPLAERQYGRRRSVEDVDTAHGPAASISARIPAPAGRSRAPAISMATGRTTSSGSTRRPARPTSGSSRTASGPRACSPARHPLGYQVAGIGDFNHDGTSDVLWFNPTTRHVDEWNIVNGHWAGSNEYRDLSRCGLPDRGRRRFQQRRHRRCVLAQPEHRRDGHLAAAEREVVRECQPRQSSERLGRRRHRRFQRRRHQRRALVQPGDARQY